MLKTSYCLVTGYGKKYQQRQLDFDEEDFQKLFAPDVREIVLEFDGQKHFGRLPDSFFRHYPYLRSAYISPAEAGKKGKNRLNRWLKESRAATVKLRVIKPYKHFGLEIGMVAPTGPPEGTIYLGKHVTVCPGMQGGQPCFDGTRLMVRPILEMVAKGYTFDEIIPEWFGVVSKESITEAVNLALEALEELYTANNPDALKRAKAKERENVGEPSAGCKH
jgi:uncharacterized protein (DUF433 family)